MGKNTLLNRLVAGASAMAVAGLAMAGATSAYAVDNVDPDETGTLTIEKYEKDTNLQNPLQGVEFTLCEVKTNGERVDLTTDAAWTAFASWSPTNLPNGTVVSTSADDCDTATTNAQGVATFEDVEVGIYQVKETGSGSNLIKRPADPFLVAMPMPEGQAPNWTFTYDVNAKPKNELNEVEVDKTAQDPAQRLYQAGQVVDWDITSTIPASEVDYTSVELTDTVASGLEFQSWVSISLGGTALVEGTDYTTNGNVLTLTPAGLQKVNAGKNADQSLTAVARTLVNETGVRENEIDLNLNGKGMKDTGTTNWAEANLVKKSSDGDRTLAGAEFELYEATDGVCMDGNVGPKIGDATTNEQGEASWKFYVGRDDDKALDICLKETKAPAGHVLPANQWFEKKTVTAGETASYAYGDIVNHKPGGPDLPETGADGTRALMLGGMGLLLAAGAFAVRHRVTARR